MTAPIRLLIVEDHAVVRQSLRFVLDQEPDIEVVGEASTAAVALSLAAAARPDVVLLDLFLPDDDGTAVLRRLREAYPDLAVVVLTSAPDDGHLLAALHAGAAAYLEKTASVGEVLATVRAAGAGQNALAPGVTARLLRAMRERERAAEPLNRLTPRELDVLGAIAKGQSNRDIARGLRITEETVKTHVSSILAKLGLADRTQAAIYALRHGIITT